MHWQAVLGTSVCVSVKIVSHGCGKSMPTGITTNEGIDEPIRELTDKEIQMYNEVCHWAKRQQIYLDLCG